MALPFKVEAQMERRHINLRHMSFIFDEHLCVIPYIYPSFNGECPNSQKFIKKGGRIRTHCKLLARADSIKVGLKNNGFHCFETSSNACKL